MRIHRAFTLGLAVLVASACAKSRSVEETTAALECTRCHGGQADQSGAPPLDTRGGSDASLPSVGAHAAHVAAGLDCGACHVKPARSGDGHIDGQARIVWGAVATANGTLSPSYDGAGAAPTHGCSAVYCHGAFTGGNAATPVWTASGEGQAACGTCHGDPAAAASALPRTAHAALAAGATNASCAACHPETVDASGAIVAGGRHVDGTVQTDARARHPAGWLNPSSASFHGDTSAVDARGCADCHAIAGPARVTTVTCADCHLGGQAWTTTCNGCHGEAGDPRGAPPADVRGNTATSFVGVGAHRRHVDGSAVAGPIGCAFCHDAPADAFDEGHLDGAVTVTSAGAPWVAARAELGWNRATATCATSYCHSAWAPANVPVWTDPRGAACGTCHDLPPGGVHPPVAADLTGCSVCHPDSITAAGQVLPAPGGAHLNGQVDRTGGHSAAFVGDSASPEFHAWAAGRGIAQCQACHGADLSGGFTGVACAQCHGATWQTRCTMCHGGVGSQTGAPPRTIWGYGADPVRTGGHSAHVNGSAVFGPIDCAVCHAKPTDALSPGHMDTAPAGTDPVAEVAFSGAAVLQGAGAPWDRTSPSCAVYCHGATLAVESAGTHTAPSWTGGDSHGTCGSCHALPPGGTHPPSPRCGNCHLGYTATEVNLAVHIDGEVAPPQLDCFSCHGDRTRSATAANPMLPAAPPAGTRGELDVAQRAVGAHQLHLAGTLTDGVACAECHALPTTFGEGTGHPSGAVELAWGPLAAGTTFDPTALTCSSSYCHGNFRLGNALNAPTWTAPAADACGTCHGLPPALPHPANPECGRCHPGYTSTSVNLVAHVNGQLDADLTCASCHGDAARVPVPGADPNVRAAPPVTATGRPAGAHAKHANPAVAVTTPVQCAECHAGAVPTTLAHSNETIEVAFGGRATANGANPGLPAPRQIIPTAGAAPSYDAGASTCSATYCHGNYSGTYAYPVWDWGSETSVIHYATYAGLAGSPAWTDGPTTCGSCHGSPPAQTGWWHSGSHGSLPSHNDCQLCHPGVSSVGGVPTGISDPSTHVNGAIDVTPQWTNVCFNCH